MDENKYKPGQENEWESDESQSHKDEESDDFGLPDVSYDPYNKEQEKEYDYGQSDYESSYENKEQDDDINPGDEAHHDHTYDENYGSTGYEDKEQTEEHENYDDPYYHDEETEKEDNTGKVLLIILIILVLVAGLWAGYEFWLKNIINPPAEESITNVEVVDEPNEEETGGIPPEALNPEEAEPEPEATTPPPSNTGSQASSGASNNKTISTIQSRTGKYWVVVGSFIDDDMALDFGKKLMSQGTGSFLIYPYGDQKYYRLAIDEADSWSQASNLLDNYRTKYGNEVWILKY